MSQFQRLAKTTARGTLWIYAALIIGKGLVFVSTIILARLLAPEDFGLLALGLITINYLDALKDLGVGDALIYKQEDPERAANNAFVVSVGMGTLLSLIAFLAAPLVGVFFEEPRVVPLVQVLAIKFLFSSLGSIHGTRLKKQLDFRRRFVSEIGRSFVKGGVSVLMAWQGFGVWSLVWGQLAGEVASTLTYWWLTRWMPRITFDFKITKSLIIYGSQTILISVMSMIDDNMDYLVIGRRMDVIQLGYYMLAFRLPELIVINVCHVVSRALFPAYATIKHNAQALRSGYLTALRYISLITIPAGLGLFIIAPEFVRFFYTDRWSPAIPAMQCLSLYAVVYSLSFADGDIYKSTGRLGILNRLNVLDLLLTVPVLWAAAGKSIFYVAIGQLVTSLVITIIRLGLVSRVMNIRPLAICHALRPAFLAGGVMFVGTYGLYTQVHQLHLISQLLIVVLAGASIYITTLWFTDRGIFKQAAALIST